MKVALIISGQPRNARECYSHIYEKIIEPNNIQDVFLHSWIDPNMFGKSYIARWRRKLLHDQGASDYDSRSVASKPVPPDIDKIILDLYKPKKWKFEQPKIFNYNKNLEKFLHNTMFPQDVLSWMYSMWQANLLKKEYEREQGIIYDTVMRIRFDALFTDKIYLDKYTDSNTIYASDRYPPEIGMNDIWCVCHSSLMDIYTDMFSNFGRIVLDAPVPLIHEMMLKRWIEEINKINVSRLDIDFGTMLI